MKKPALEAFFSHFFVLIVIISSHFKPVKNLKVAIVIADRWHILTTLKI